MSLTEYSPSWVTRLIWWFSGANIDLLKKLPSEKNRYLAVGLSMLFTFMISLGAGLYVFWNVFQNVFATLVYGIIAGVLVLLINKYTVSLAEWHSTKLRIVRCALPSIIFCFLLALLISFPIRLFLFQADIHSEYNYEKQRKNNEVFKNYKQVIEDSSAKLENDLEIKKLELNAKYYHNSKKPLGADTAFNSDSEEKDYYRSRAEYENLSSLNAIKLEILKKQLSDFGLEKEQKDKEGSPTLLQRLDVFQELLKKYQGVALTFSIIVGAWLIFLIPTFIKICSKSPYDTLRNINDYLLIQKILNAEDLDNNEKLHMAAEIEKLKTKLHIKDAKNPTQQLKESLENARKSLDSRSYESRLSNILDSFSTETRNTEAKAKELFTMGIFISGVGIMGAIGFIIYWKLFFSQNKFETYHVYLLSSATIIVLVIEFLGAWFLKQHRLTSEKSLHILCSKAILERYLLSHLAIENYSQAENKEKYLKDLLVTLSKDLRFPNSAYLNGDYSNFATDSVSGISETIGKLK